MTDTKPKTTAVTENDKIGAARAKDYDANLKATSDVPREEQTAAHEAANRLLPSDIDAFATEHSLTSAEAADALAQGGTKEDVDAVKAGRSVYRPVWVETPAGVSSPFADTAAPVVPVPPDPSVFDPNAPRGDEPTGHVAGHDHTEEAKEALDTFTDRADEAVADLEGKEEKGADADTPVVPVE